jgi:hypothetical protein
MPVWLVSFAGTSPVLYIEQVDFFKTIKSRKLAKIIRKGTFFQG